MNNNSNFEHQKHSGSKTYLIRFKNVKSDLETTVDRAVKNMFKENVQLQECPVEVSPQPGQLQKNSYVNVNGKLMLFEDYMRMPVVKKNNNNSNNTGSNMNKTNLISLEEETAYTKAVHQHIRSTAHKRDVENIKLNEDNLTDYQYEKKMYEQMNDVSLSDAEFLKIYKQWQKNNYDFSQSRITSDSEFEPIWENIKTGLNLY